MPFYFTFYVKDGGYHLSGEGTGSKKATDAAFDELKELSAPDIKKLIAETEQVKEQQLKTDGKNLP